MQSEENTRTPFFGVVAACILATNAQDTVAVPERPTLRFTVYANLPSDVVTTAEVGLGYRESSWNLLGSLPIEGICWKTNNATILDFVEHAKAIGVSDEQVWDCHINHYVDYWWFELGRKVSMVPGCIGIQRRSLYQVLGRAISERTESSLRLCYDEEIWNEIPLLFWDEQNTNDGTSLSGKDSETDLPGFLGVPRYHCFVCATDILAMKEINVKFHCLLVAKLSYV